LERFEKRKLELGEAAEVAPRYAQQDDAEPLAVPPLPNELEAPTRPAEASKFEPGEAAEVAPRCALQDVVEPPAVPPLPNEPAAPMRQKEASASVEREAAARAVLRLVASKDVQALKASAAGRLFAGAELNNGVTPGDAVDYFVSMCHPAYTFAFIGKVQRLIENIYWAAPEVYAVKAWDLLLELAWSSIGHEAINTLPKTITGIQPFAVDPEARAIATKAVVKAYSNGNRGYATLFAAAMNALGDLHVHGAGSSSYFDPNHSSCAICDELCSQLMALKGVHPGGEDADDTLGSSDSDAASYRCGLCDSEDAASDDDDTSSQSSDDSLDIYAPGEAAEVAPRCLPSTSAACSADTVSAAWPNMAATDRVLFGLDIFVDGDRPNLWRVKATDINGNVMVRTVSVCPAKQLAVKMARALGLNESYAYLMWSTKGGAKLVPVSASRRALANDQAHDPLLLIAKRGA